MKRKPKTKWTMRIYYNEETDYFVLFMGKSRPNYGVEIRRGITVFKDEKTDEIVGLGILGFKMRTKNLKEIKINLFSLPKTKIYK